MRRGTGYACRPAAPERLRLRRRLARGGAHRRDRDPAQHVLDEPRAPRTVAECRYRIVTGDNVVSRARLCRHAAGRCSRARLGGRAAAPRSLGAGVACDRALRRVFRRRARVDGRRCRGGGRCSHRRRSPRGRGSGPARGPHGDRAHVGFDERTEGCDPSARPVDPPRRQPQRAAPLRRGRGVVLELAVLLDRWVRVRPARHIARGRDAGLLERNRPPGHARPARARRGPRW